MISYYVQHHNFAVMLVAIQQLLLFHSFIHPQQLYTWEGRQTFTHSYKTIRYKYISQS
jgi:hypothetical protein